MEDILDGDRRLEGGAWVPGGPFALHDRDHRQLLVRQAIGLRVARTNTGIVNKVGDSHRPIGLLELVVGLLGATKLWVRPTPERLYPFRGGPRRPRLR